MSHARSAWLRSFAERTGAKVAELRHAVPVLDLCWVFAERFRRLNGSVLAGNIAYRLFVWLAPFVLVLTGLLGAQATAELDLTRFASDLGVSDASASSFADGAETSFATALAVGIPALALATLSLIRGCHFAYAQVWEIEIEPRKAILVSAGRTLIGAVVLFVVYLALAAIQRSGLLLAVGGWLASLALTSAVLLGLVWVLPRRTSRVSDLWPGPVLGALALSGIEVFGAVYLPRATQGASQAYGAFGLAIALLFVQFLMAFVFIGMAFVNSVWTDRREIIGGRSWVVDPEVVPRLARRPARWAANKSAGARLGSSLSDSDD